MGLRSWGSLADFKGYHADRRLGSLAGARSEEVRGRRARSRPRAVPITDTLGRYNRQYFDSYGQDPRLLTLPWVSCCR